MVFLEVSIELVQKDLEVTRKAIEKIKIVAPEKSYARKMAEDFFNMAESYYKDARHFLEKGDIVKSYGCVYYAHGWLDAGARLGIFDTGGDNRLFTLLE